MPYLSAKQAEALGKLLGKLREKSSVAGYLIALLGSVGVTDTGWVPQLAGWIAIGASLLLFLFNDRTIHSWLVSEPSPAEAMEPAPAGAPPEPLAAPAATRPTPEEPLMTSKIAAYFAVAKVAAAAVITAEASAPANATGADKLDIAKSALEAAYPELGIVDVAFEAIWPLVKPFIDALVAKFKTVPAATVATT